MEIIHGLHPTKKDTRDFKLGQITTLPALSELPENFQLDGIEIMNQRDTDFCTQFALCGMSELQEGVRLAPEWCFAKSKEISKDINAYGQDIRVALSVHTKYGAPEAKECPLNVDNANRDTLADIRNYPDMGTKPVKHIKKTYVDVTGQYDAFDDIRVSIWKYRNEKRGVVSGVLWGWDTHNPIINTIPNTNAGHCIYFAGWKTIENVPYLIIVNSYGAGVGDVGTFYMSREVVNHFVDMYGAYMFIDMSPEDVKYMLDNGIKDKDSWMIQLLKALLTFLQMQSLFIKKKIEVTPVTPPVTPKPMEKTLLDVFTEALGTDVTPADTTPDLVDCVETITTIAKRKFPEIPVLLGTPAWNDYMSKPTSNFLELKEPEPECFVVAITKGKNHGHAWFMFPDGWFGSNNSVGKDAGKFTKNYRWETIVKNYQQVLGLEIKIYKHL